ncbi:hypothetical protein [Novosphingobium rosa]|uniref:hypothetical protein n=1 Tax=Novosphingobium rosa TaxID=76978 RepID=UPI0008370C2D|nr:hypothetical protein [Novosphingobium rosa]
MPQTFEIDVTQTIKVSLDPAKFTDAFMEQFRASFFPFFTLADHAHHIAQMQARGVIDLTSSPEFVEGYGPSAEMGIAVQVESAITDLIREYPA